MATDTTKTQQKQAEQPKLTADSPAAQAQAAAKSQPKPETNTPLGPGTSEAPLVIKTNELIADANVDPRGDNRPGVIPDQPLQEGIDAVTNLREDLVDPETHIPRPASEWPTGVMNPPVSGAPKLEGKSSGSKMAIRLTADYWPATKPDDWSDEDKANREYRVKSGETVELPEEEGLRLLDQRLGHRANPRG